MDMLTKLMSRAEQAEVWEVWSESTAIEFQANRLKTSRVEETRGTAVRVVKNGRLGFAASSDASVVDRLVDNALESAVYGDQVPIAFPSPAPAPEVRTYDQRIADLPIRRLVELGQQIVDSLLEIEPDARIDVGLARGIHHVSLCNNAGTDIGFKCSPLSITVDLTRVRGDDILTMYDMAGRTVWEDDPLAFVRRLEEKLKLAQKSATIRSGRMPVLFSPAGGMILGLPLLLGLNGRDVYKGVSPMAGKIGQTLFDPKITVIDDATLDGRFGSAPYDDEGVAHARNVLIDEGVLKGFMYDLKTAAQSGAKPTGNGQRGLFSTPRPAPTNLIVAAGSTPLEEMIAGVDQGLLVESALGVGQGNTMSGAFSNPLSLAFKIEKGEIVGRVKGVSLAGNIYTVLRKVAAVSQESEWVYSSLRMPYVLLPDMNVVVKE